MTRLRNLAIAALPLLAGCSNLPLQIEHMGAEPVTRYEAVARRSIAAAMRASGRKRLPALPRVAFCYHRDLFLAFFEMLGGKGSTSRADVIGFYHKRSNTIFMDVTEETVKRTPYTPHRVAALVGHEGAHWMNYSHRDVENARDFNRFMLRWRLEYQRLAFGVW